MSYNFSKFSARADETTQWLKGELATIRTGRASVALLDGVKIEAYGSRMPMNQVANVVSEDARTLRITPFDRTQIQEIEKAINDADLGVSVSVDDSGLRAIFPELTAERREILIKQAHKKLEEARISLRNERDETQKDIDASQKASDISEDEKFAAKEQMQKIVDETQKKFDEMVSEKEAEINS
jgi:ribosome recycling factor